MKTLELIIFASLVIWGVYASIQEGMIFERFGKWILHKTEINNGLIISTTWKFPKWARKPVASCPVCMSSIYGTIIYAFAYFGGWIELDYQIVHYICYVFAVSGLNYIVLNY